MDDRSLAVELHDQLVAIKGDVCTQIERDYLDFDVRPTRHALDVPELICHHIGTPDWTMQDRLIDERMELRWLLSS